MNFSEWFLGFLVAAAIALTALLFVYAWDGLFSEKSESWHVSWIAHRDGYQPSYGDGWYTVQPALTGASLRQLRHKLAEDTALKAGKGATADEFSVQIMGLTRLRGE